MGVHISEDLVGDFGILPEAQLLNLTMEFKILNGQKILTNYHIDNEEASKGITPTMIKGLADVCFNRLNDYNQYSKLRLVMSVSTRSLAQSIEEATNVVSFTKVHSIDISKTNCIWELMDGVLSFGRTHYDQNEFYEDYDHKFSFRTESRETTGVKVDPVTIARLNSNILKMDQELVSPINIIIRSTRGWEDCYTIHGTVYHSQETSSSELTDAFNKFVKSMVDLDELDDMLGPSLSDGSPVMYQIGEGLVLVIKRIK